MPTRITATTGVGIRRGGPKCRPETAHTFWGHSGHWGSFMFTSRRCVRRSPNGNRAQDNRWLFSRIVDCRRTAGERVHATVADFDGRPLANRCRRRFLRIGGVDQWVMVRGRDTANCC